MKRPALNQLPGWPRLMSRPLAAAYVGLSPSGFDRWLDDIPSVKIGSKKLYDLDDLNAAIR